jgi:hypothetical protein
MARLLSLLLLAIAAPSITRATTLPPELNAYDFGEAYYIEDGGVVVSPYANGFYCPHGIATPEGIRVMPGGMFIQFDEGQQVEEVYHLLPRGHLQIFDREGRAGPLVRAARPEGRHGRFLSQPLAQPRMVRPRLRRPEPASRPRDLAHPPEV